MCEEKKSTPVPYYDCFACESRAGHAPTAYLAMPDFRAFQRGGACSAQKAASLASRRSSARLAAPTPP